MTKVLNKCISNLSQQSKEGKIKFAI